MDSAVQFLGLMLLGAVVLMGARQELRQSRWGPMAWRIMAVLFAVTAVVVGVLLWKRETSPRPSILVPAEGGIHT